MFSSISGKIRISPDIATCHIVDKSPQLRIIYLDHKFLLCTNTKGVIFLIRILKFYLFIWLKWELVVVHRLSICGTWAPKCMGSVVGTRRLGCFQACGILVP